MDNHSAPRVEDSATRGGLPVAPSMAPAIENVSVAHEPSVVGSRVLFISALSILLALAAGVVAWALMLLIALITNISFYGRISIDPAAPSTERWGWLTVAVPVIGGLIVGFMARYGSQAIRGHGIPEAMEQVLTGQSRIPARLTFLKPISSAIAIGTGGPFGAEGPIIATGAALGSLIGQIIETTAVERKTLLAAGAAAGMAATFGTPVSAVLLAIELLLFEMRPRSFIPVALATTTAAGVRFLFHLPYPVFVMPAFSPGSQAALISYIIIGAIIGVASVFVTRAVYLVEDAFALLPIHWMWWPAIGAVAVGVIGMFAPATLGVGYDNISSALQQSLTLQALAVLCVLKFTSWCIALGSGTSGGTLAPLFTIGSALGALLGAAAAHLIPHAGIDVRVAALVGMAALFAGASRALMTSVVFSFETTLHSAGLLPLLGGCTAAYLVSCMMMRDSIMTAKIVHRGVRVPFEYEADFLHQALVSDVMTASPKTLRSDQSVQEVVDWISSRAPDSTHQGFPVIDPNGHVRGILTRRKLLDPTLKDRAIIELIERPALTIQPSRSLRDAADLMVTHDVGRLAVVDSGELVGILTRGDVLSAHRKRLHESTHRGL